MEELSSHWISITNTGKRIIYKLQIGRNSSHGSHARGLQAHSFPLWSQVSCRGKSVMAFGYSCKSSRLAYGRNVFDKDSDSWYRSNPERLFFHSASGHHTLGHLLIPASLGLADTPCFLHSSQTMATLRLPWCTSLTNMDRYQCKLGLLWDLGTFKNVCEHPIWLLKEYKNHMEDTEILAL